MSDEPHNDNLLVDQNDALDFYFDAMLLSDETESQLEESKEEHQESDHTEHDVLPSREDAVAHTADKDNKQAVTADTMQSSKEFLLLSKQRQQQKIQPKSRDNLAPEIHQQTDESESTLPPFTKTQVITKGPVSPKPREPEFSKKKSFNEPLASGSNIVFTGKNDDGKEVAQVLIPRSQKLASLKQSTHTMRSDNSAKENNPDLGAAQRKPEKPEQAKNIVIEKKITSAQMHLHDDTADTNDRKIRQKNSSATSRKKEPRVQSELKSNTQEAPNLDLSLFLPKIKTLSDAEIAQQIEALTQAAVTQAQLKSDAAHEVKELASAQTNTTNQAEIDDGPVRNINNAPSWAVPDFQALLFVVGGLKMAVPLCELNGIVEWGEDYLTELPGHKSWYLGIIQNQGKNVPVIDTLQQVVPENRWPAEHLKKKNFRHIILIDNSRWGLACETVMEVITLKTDSVKWRSSRTKRRWLLGTVIEHMCALLDSSEFAAMLKTGDDSLIS